MGKLSPYGLVLALAAACSGSGSGETRVKASADGDATSAAAVPAVIEHEPRPIGRASLDAYGWRRGPGREAFARA
ncbi:MAG: hypothetical protein F9K40_10010, partial [Kofleriaceae bacterium]